jgi:4-amino-4-deoxy-L-arabinose transferase-like glycosyltransferase
MQPLERIAPRRVRARTGLAAALSWLAVACAALLPRIFGLGAYITSDEANFWIRRSDAFLRALQRGDFAATALSTHPGVTTTWLGSVGILLSRALGSAGLLDGSFAGRLALLQLPVALANALAVLAGYALLQRMLPRSVALMGALLWALDPFVFGYSRLLHVDALAGSFLTLSTRAACLAWNHQRRWRWVLGSGICAGLALLSKSPAIVLVPATGLLALRAGLRATGGDAGGWFVLPAGRAAGRRMAIVLPYLAWCAAAGLTVFLLWPALWVAPLRPIELIRLGVEAEGAQPHMLGNFFMGREDNAPGLLFYPVALALRLTPITLLGLLLLALVWRKAGRVQRHDMAALALVALLLIVGLDLFPKKFNRYLLPAMPAIDILAAWGLVWGARTLARWRIAGRAAARTCAAGLCGLALVGAAGLAITWRSHSLAYFNPLLGGARVGANTFSAGWGEGLELAADWLNAQPDITGVLIASTSVPMLQPYLRPGAQSVTPADSIPAQAGYVVIYLGDAQGQAPWPPFDVYFHQHTPLYTVRLHGVEYAWIYQVPPTPERALAADFGPAVSLRGLTPLAPARPGGLLRYQAFWQARATPAQGAMLFVHLIGADGQTYARADLPVDTASWQAQRYYTNEIAVPLPATLPSGCYQLVAGMYDPASGARLPLSAGTALDPAVDGADALALDRACVP